MKSCAFYVIDFKGNSTPVNCHRYYSDLSEAIKKANNAFNKFLDDFCSSHECSVINDYVHDDFGYVRQVVLRLLDGYCTIITLSIHREEFSVK